MERATLLAVIAYTLVLVLGFTPIMRVDGLIVTPLHIPRTPIYALSFDIYTVTYAPLLTLSLISLLTTLTPTISEKVKGDILLTLNTFAVVWLLIAAINFTPPTTVTDTVDTVEIVWEPHVTLYPTFYMIRFAVPAWLLLPHTLRLFGEPRVEG